MGILISGRVGAPDSIAPGANKAGRLELIELPYQIDVGRPVTDSSSTQVWLIESSRSVSLVCFASMCLPERRHPFRMPQVVLSFVLEMERRTACLATRRTLKSPSIQRIWSVNSTQIRLIDIIGDEPADSWIYLVQTPKWNIAISIFCLNPFILRVSKAMRPLPLGFISHQLLTSSNYSRLEALPIVDEVGTAISLDATENRGGNRLLMLVSITDPQMVLMCPSTGTICFSSGDRQIPKMVESVYTQSDHRKG